MSKERFTERQTNTGSALSAVLGGLIYAFPIVAEHYSTAKPVQAAIISALFIVLGLLVLSFAFFQKPLHPPAGRESLLFRLAVSGGLGFVAIGLASYFQVTQSNYTLSHIAILPSVAAAVGLAASFDRNRGS